MNKKNKVFAFNIKKRVDRLKHINSQFENRSEFDLEIVSKPRNLNGALGLWINIIETITKAIELDLEYVILCEDDHQFSKGYSAEKLEKCIAEAAAKDADILLLGVSWFKSAIQVSFDLVWVNDFSGLQFAVVYRKFYGKILGCTFIDGDVADHKISSLTINKFVVYPFMSTQKDFGYSDVTSLNNRSGEISRIFRAANSKMFELLKVQKNYTNISNTFLGENYIGFAISTYIFCANKSVEKVKQQFRDKDEFDVKYVAIKGQGITSSGLWLAIQETVKLALDDDVIILCTEDHQFTPSYSRNKLFSNIVYSHSRGADIVSGGCHSLSVALQISDEQFWVDQFLNFQFLIIFKKIYRKILEYSFKENDSVAKAFSLLTSSKILIYPFISVKTDVEEPVISTGTSRNSFVRISSEELDSIKFIYSKFLTSKN